MADQIPTTKLPIIPTFIQVLLIMKERYMYFIKFSIPIVLFIALLFMLGESLALQNGPGFMSFVLMAVLILITSMVVVAFHRTFIMRIDDVNKTAIFRLSSREFKFIGWYIVIFVFVVIIMGVIGFFFIGSLKEGALPSFSIHLIGLPVYYVIARWLLVIPAASVDDDDASIASCLEPQKTTVGA